MNRAVFPGSFDPITLGHVDIIKRARIKAFDIINKDPKLKSIENRLIKKEFLINYKDMLEFININ